MQRTEESPPPHDRETPSHPVGSGSEAVRRSLLASRGYTLIELSDQRPTMRLSEICTHASDMASVPGPRGVIDAIARRDQIRVLVDGMTAADDLGLTNAVPAMIVVHADARLKPIQLGKLEILFMPTAASKLYWAGRPAMRLIQALHWLRDTRRKQRMNLACDGILKAGDETHPGLFDVTAQPIDTAS